MSSPSEMYADAARGRQYPLTRSFESNGPDVKIRGTALHIAEKYVTLARDAQSSGDRVMAENYLQHAEHYFRVIAAAQAQNPQNAQQPQPSYRSDQDDEGLDEEDDRFSERFGQAHNQERGQQGDAEAALQVADLGGQGGLADVGAGRRAPEAPVLGHGEERLHLPQLHAPTSLP